MKIGFFTDTYDPQINGVATSTKELKDSLKKENYDIQLVAPEVPKYKDKDKDIVRLKSFRFVKNPELRLAYMFPDSSLRKVLTGQYELIHGFSGGSIASLGLFLAKLKKIPYIFTYNTRFNEYTHYVFNGKLIKPKVVEITVAAYCNKCDFIIAPSDFVKEELISFGVNKPIEVIPNGIDTNKFNISKSNLLRDKLNLKKNAKIILYTGRVSKEKDIDFIIQSFKKVSEKINNSYLVIAGDGPEKRNLIKLAKKLNLSDRIFFLGYVKYEDVPQIYSSADLFAFASTTETQGMVILEAMASGLCVLTVKHEVFEAVLQNGLEGLIVEKNIDIFADKMLEALKDEALRKKLSENARKRAENFSLSHIAKKFDKLYKKAL